MRAPLSPRLAHREMPSARLRTMGTNRPSSCTPAAPASARLMACGRPRADPRRRSSSARGPRHLPGHQPATAASICARSGLPRRTGRRSARGVGISSNPTAAALPPTARSPCRRPLAMVEAADRSGIGHDTPALLPVLVSVDVPQHEGLGLCREQRTRRELVVEAGHRYVVFGDAAGDRAMGHTDGRNQRLPCRPVAGRKTRPAGPPVPGPARQLASAAPTLAATVALLTVGTQSEQDSRAVGQLVPRPVRPPARIPRCGPGAAPLGRCDRARMHAVAAPSRRKIASVPGGSWEKVPCSISTGQ